MALTKCRLCGMLFTSGGRKNICPLCIKRLEELYGSVHEYMRDHKDEEFDIYTLAEATESNIADIQALVDLGYIERDLGLYGTRETARSRLAKAITNEIDKMNRNKLTTYGGEIYARSYDREDREDRVRTVRRR